MAAGGGASPTTNAVTSVTIMTTVPIWWSVIQWSKPNSGSTGRGAPVTSGFAIRSATAPVRALAATAPDERDDAGEQRRTPAMPLGRAGGRCRAARRGSG